jgi:hypothetical protein
MHLDIQVISGPKEICANEHSWNESIGTLSQIPFFFSGFVKQFMEFQRSTGWNPLVLVFSINDRIVGVAPFMQKKFFGIPAVRFLFWPAYSPELIIDSDCRKNCLERTLDYLFETFRCKLVDIYLPLESPNIPLLRETCKESSFHFSTRIVPESGHRVLQIAGDWNSFETSRGGKFKRKFKKMERKLNQVGSTVVKCFDNPGGNSDVIGKIQHVEKASWKETWRMRKGDTVDPEISMLWQASQETDETQPDFTWKVWFLELDCHVIAYSIVFEYKQTVFISKITYDKSYREYYPGIYLVNAIIRDSFNRGDIRKIDFQTDLPFMETWAGTRMPRVRVMMGKGFLPAILETMLNSNYFVKARNVLLESLVEKIPSVRNLGLWSER